ncbi:MAG: glutathione S-transferase [Rhodospirillaceae bacterium]|nr:glutathione S-transferase [Rhodospirillaceae bacterium]
MSPDPKLTLFHSPNTRSTGALILLEELGAPYELHAVNMKAGDQRKPAYMAINPMGKVPAVKHGDALITEQGAIFIYLADLFPKAGLTPVIGDPLRGPFIRWLVYYGSCFEPAVVDKSMKREQAPLGMSPYGDFDTMLKTVSDQLRKGPYICGERFTAADVLWGTAMKWMIDYKLVPESPEFVAYRDCILSRAAYKKVSEMDAKMATEHAAAAAKSAS